MGARAGRRVELGRVRGHINILPLGVGGCEVDFRSVRGLGSSVSRERASRTGGTSLVSRPLCATRTLGWGWGHGCGPDEGPGKDRTAWSRLNLGLSPDFKAGGFLGMSSHCGGRRREGAWFPSSSRE